MMCQEAESRMVMYIETNFCILYSVMYYAHLIIELQGGNIFRLIINLSCMILHILVMNGGFTTQYS